MIVDVTEVVLEPRAQGRDAAAEEFRGHLEQRMHGVFQRDQFPLDPIPRLDVITRGLPGEDALLELFDLVGHHVDHGKVAFDDGVQENVEHVGRAMPQEIRFEFGARSDIGKAHACRLADGQDEIGPDKDRGLAGVEIAAGVLLDRLHDGEELIAVFVEFGALMPALRVLDGEIVQVELVLHFENLAGLRIFQRDPDEAARPAAIRADLCDRYIPKTLAVFVRDAANEHRYLPARQTPQSIPPAQSPSPIQSPAPSPCRARAL